MKIYIYFHSLFLLNLSIKLFNWRAYVLMEALIQGEALHATIFF